MGTTTTPTTTNTTITTTTATTTRWWWCPFLLVAKELLDTKDQQVKKMGMEYAEVKEQVKEETEKGEVALEECEQRWLKLQAHWGIEREKLQREIDRVQKELHQVIRERDREKGIADDRAAPDPELDILRAEVKKKEEQLLIVEAGIQNIVDENQRLMNELELAKIREETVSDNWEPQIRWRDERYAAMVKEHESVKEILTMEMLKAHEALKTIEDQVRKIRDDLLQNFSISFFFTFLNQIQLFVPRFFLLFFCLLLLCVCVCVCVCKKKKTKYFS